MEIAAYVIGIAVAILGLISAACFSLGHRDTGLWTTCAALVLIVIGGCCWYQGVLWRKDEDRKKTEPPPRHARVLFVETRLILAVNESDPIRIPFGLINVGDADAVVRIRDRTYFLSVDSAQTAFRYQASSAEEIQVPAIPNAIWHGEMRFFLKLTPQILEALNTGKARLFFYARGEYRDATGVYPLPFAEMYDATFPGNLIAPPRDIVFE